MQTLATVQKGKRFSVQQVINSTITAKLVEMGLYVGQEVEVLFKAPFGDPIAVNVGGYVLSLRLNEASLIEVA
ncbi:MAG: ferrous iron transport protein A [Crocinitomicaceae bacterium]|jgi:ferrous iron transport protein A|nr:ferrous iron transport protein A [Crocinitomicaceae bacterium]